MTLAILPSAGFSRRMGRPKLLLPWGDTTVIGAVVAAFRGAGIAAPLLVLGPASAASAASSSSLDSEAEQLRAWAAAAGLPTAVNLDPERGMLSSIRAGIETLGGGAELARRGEILLVSPADLPALTSATIVELLRRMRSAPFPPLALPRHGGRRGHPLAIAPHLIPEIEGLDPAIGLRQLRDRHAAALAEVDLDDPGCIADLDTPGDYTRLTDLALR
jgi:molybdenum cofactor cytidylyltransferase